MSIINGSRPLPEVKSIEKQAHPEARQTGQETPSFSLRFCSANCRRLAILLVHLLLYFYATEFSFQLNNRTFLCGESVHLKALQLVALRLTPSHVTMKFRNHLRLFSNNRKIGMWQF